jgi:hypothetical protein
VKAPAYTPAIAAPWNWTGFYLGGHIGGRSEGGDIADPLGVPIYAKNDRTQLIVEADLACRRPKRSARR